jgi:hypothetical protein
LCQNELYDSLKSYNKNRAFDRNFCRILCPRGAPASSPICCPVLAAAAAPLASLPPPAQDTRTRIFQSFPQPKGLYV